MKEGRGEEEACSKGNYLLHELIVSDEENDPGVCQCSMFVQQEKK